MERLILGRKGAERLQQGHPWIYRSDLLPDPGAALPNGAAVAVHDERGRPLGTAFYSVHSQIALRFVSREIVEVDEAFLRARLEAAIGLRERLFPGQRFLRLVHGESDGLPGLVVDRYGEHLSIQTPIPATDMRREAICDLLEALLAPAGIVERNDLRTRQWERLEARKGVIRGRYEAPTVWEEGEARLEIDLIEGQKTGSFLDQQENHLLAGRLAGGSALDLFSYAGGFALQMARRAERVKAVEISAQACAGIRRNAALSGVENLEVVEANAFDWLRDELAAGGRYETIVLDPPAFAKSKASLAAASRGYKEVNLRALQLLAPGGLLFTFTCSFHMGAAAFEELVLAAARDARRQVQVLQRLGASRDHPELLGVPETRYLKGLVLRSV